MSVFAWQSSYKPASERIRIWRQVSEDPKSCGNTPGDLWFLLSSSIPIPGACTCEGSPALLSYTQPDASIGQKQIFPNPLLPYILNANLCTTETLPHPPRASSFLQHTPDSSRQPIPPPCRLFTIPWKTPPTGRTGLLPMHHCHSTPATGGPGVASCGSLLPEFSPSVVGPQDSKDKSFPFGSPARDKRGALQERD